jgi:hypothetical protein
MKKQIDKLLIVIGGIALAVLNGLIPTLFLKEQPEFTDNKNILQTIESQLPNQNFPRPNDLPQDEPISLLKTTPQITSSLFTSKTFFHNIQLQVSTPPANDEQAEEFKFQQEIRKKIPEYQALINYSPIIVKYIPTTSTQTTAQAPVKCEKPTLSISDKSPGKVIITATAQENPNVEIVGFKIYRDDQELFQISNNETKEDTNVEPDKEYKYKAQTICKDKRSGQLLPPSEAYFSEEITAKVKRSFYLKCLNTAALSTSVNLIITRYKEDGSSEELTGRVKTGTEIQAKGYKTGLTLLEVTKQQVLKGKQKSLVATIKYCKLDPQKAEECLPNTEQTLTCEDPTTPPPTDGTDKQKKEEKKEEPPKEDKPENPK